MRNNRELDGLVALPINVDVVEIIEAAKQSIATGRAVVLPRAPVAPAPAGKTAASGAH
jgi:hypothetical protein